MQKFPSITPKSSSTNSKFSHLEVHLFRKIQTISKQTKHIIMFLEIQGSCRNHHFAVVTTFEEALDLFQQVLFTYFDLIHSSITSIHSCGKYVIHDVKIKSPKLLEIYHVCMLFNYIEFSRFLGFSLIQCFSLSFIKIKCHI